MHGPLMVLGYSFFLLACIEFRGPRIPDKAIAFAMEGVWLRGRRLSIRQFPR